MRNRLPTLESRLAEHSSLGPYPGTPGDKCMAGISLVLFLWLALLPGYPAPTWTRRAT